MQGSSKGLLFAALASVALAGAFGGALPAAAHKPQKPSTPPPTSSVPSGPLGYYLMSGNTIVSPPYASLNDCYKDLTKVKHNLVPGSDTLVCVHRRP